MTTESFVKILTINFRLPSTNEKSLMINISASEDNTVIKMPPSLTIYSCHSVVLTLLLIILSLLLTAILSLLTASNKDSDTFSYYSLATKDLSQDKMTF